MWKDAYSSLWEWKLKPKGDTTHYTIRKKPKTKNTEILNMKEDMEQPELINIAG